MAHRQICCALIVVLACWVGCWGCGGKTPPQLVKVIETQTVEVPVPQVRVPPPELLAPLAPTLPIFLSPDDATAVSALTAEGEHQFQALIEELLTRLAAWQTWATAP